MWWCKIQGVVFRVIRNLTNIEAAVRGVLDTNKQCALETTDSFVSTFMALIGRRIQGVVLVEIRHLTNIEAAVCGVG